MKRICIIKLKSAGDVLRTTPILRAFTGCDITWITAEKAYPFIKGNPLIRDAFSIDNLPALGRFDAVYNFDEDEKACMAAEAIPAELKKGYGYRYGGFYPFDEDADYAYRMARDDELKFRINKKTYQEIIFEMAGMKWSGQDYVLNYRPSNGTINRVGLNYMAGEKFPNKFWPGCLDLLRFDPEISVQKVFCSPRDYIEWLNSCAIIVTSDSLGMHIALALKKKVAVLFGTTSMHEIEMYGRGIKLSAGLPCSPCYKKETCGRKPSCMDLISVEDVRAAIERLSEEKWERTAELETA